MHSFIFLNCSKNLYKKCWETTCRYVLSSLLCLCVSCWIASVCTDSSGMKALKNRKKKKILQNTFILSFYFLHLELWLHLVCFNKRSWHITGSELTVPFCQLLHFCPRHFSENAPHNIVRKSLERGTFIMMAINCFSSNILGNSDFKTA